MMNNYSNKSDNMFSEFLKFKNNFDSIHSVETVLVHGNPDAIGNPFITIAIPTYLRDNTLRYAIDSAINQVNPNCDFEIIVVDNDNTNQNQSATEKLIKEYSDNRLLYYRNSKNIGMAGNWNRCIELARGQWIAFLHDDDMIVKDYIKTITRLLNKRKDAGAILSDFTVLYEKNNPTNESDVRKRSILANYSEKVIKYKLMRLQSFESLIIGYNIYGAPTCGNIFKKEYLINLGGFDGSFFPSFDWYFVYKFNRNYKIYKSVAPFGYYRVFENLSLNPDTLKKFITDAIEFRDYSLKNTISGKLFVKHFRVEQHVRFVHGINNLSKFSGSTTIIPEAFNHLCPYRIRPVRYLIFTIIRELYWPLKKIVAAIFG